MIENKVTTMMNQYCLTALLSLQVESLLFLLEKVTRLSKIRFNFYVRNFVSTMARKYVPKHSYSKLTVDQRARIVHLRDAGNSQVKISKDIGCTRSTVQNVLRKFDTTGRISSVKQPGRKSVLSKQNVMNLVNMCKTNLFAPGRILRDKLKLKCSVSTVNRKLRKAGLPAFVAKKKNLLQERHKIARKVFAQERKEFDWERVIFSDEKTMQSFYNARQFVRRPRGQAWNEKYVIRIPRPSRFKVNLWGYITPTECGLFLLSNHHDKHSYLKVLQDSNMCVIADPKKQKVFMQDNASIHKAKIITEYLKEKNVDILPWPAYSPDLNPIENVWFLMQRKVYQMMFNGAKPRNAKELFSLCKYSFERVCEQNLQSLYRSFSNRCEEVIRLDGKRTKY